ncbi:hypothetical protein ACB092_11G149000 [Castanea dentata]
MALRALVTLLFVPLFLSPTILGYSQADIKKWCSQTPNPEPCEYFLSHKPNYHNPIKQKSDFFTISKQLALERALKAQSNIFSLGPKCKNAREKAAWADCLELYEYTHLRLNKTIDPNVKCSQTDAQTWLSTALTNLETCRAGFIELGVPDNLLPLMSNNVSKLISNALALNKVPYTVPSYKHGFPTWANIVVAQDGSGNYKTIKEAISAASSQSGSGRFVIYVKAGTYKENVEIKLKNIMLVGDGIGKTIVTGSKSVGGGSTTFNSATIAVVGDGFIARDITIRNTAGAANQQAVARQFYRECDIYGTVDFIFGNAAVVLQNCNIYARYPPNKTNTLTAQGRTDLNQNTGISIHDCTVKAAADLKASQSSVTTYLGRPWKEYSRTVFMKTYLDSLIAPAGWMEWSGSFALKTLYYAEYANTGPGSSTTKRVNWPGYHVITSASVASQYTVANFISGGSWLPATNVPYTASL